MSFLNLNMHGDKQMSLPLFSFWPISVFSAPYWTMGRVILSLLDKTTVKEENSFSVEKAELNRILPELQGSHMGEGLH